MSDIKEEIWDDFREAIKIMRERRCTFLEAKAAVERIKENINGDRIDGDLSEV